MKMLAPVRIAPASVLALAVAWLGAATPAAAATSWHVDPTGDATRYSATQDRFVVSKTPRGDITGVSATYDKKSLRVATSMREYRGLKGTWNVELMTSKGETYLIDTTLDVEPQTNGQVNLFRARPRGASDLIDCEGLKVARTARGITATVPTTCISGPWRLRFAPRVRAYGPIGGNPQPLAADDGFQDGRHPERGSSFSPWLRQG